MYRLVISIYILLISVPTVCQTADSAHIKSRAVPVRVAPDSTILGVLYEGTAVEVLDTKPGWKRVQFTGWVPSKEVTKAGKRPPLVIDAGRGFIISDIIFMNDISGVKFIGQVENQTEKECTWANFQITLYDTTGKVISQEESAILNMDAGESKPLSRSFWDVNIRSIGDIRVRCVKRVGDPFE